MKRLLLLLAWVCGIAAGIIILANLAIEIGTAKYVYADLSAAPEVQTIIIPGAAILKSGALSPIFKDRADMAIALYNAKKASKMLVSGNNGSENYNEVNPARTYLLKQGIPDKDIFLDHAGFDTYSTMYRAREVFGVTSAIVASQSFHLPRAIFIARVLGIRAYGVPADVGHSLLKNYGREIFADEKAVFDLILHRVPKFLGDKIPITGDGRNYP